MRPHPLAHSTNAGLEESLLKATYQDDEELDNTDPLVSRSASPERSRYSYCGLIFAVVLLAAITSTITCLLTARYYMRSHAMFDRGYATEFGSVNKVLSLAEKKRYGTLLFDHDGHASVAEDSPALQYMGAGEEVDRVWNELYGDHWFHLTEKEAEEGPGPQYKDYWNPAFNGYVATRAPLVVRASPE